LSVSHNTEQKLNRRIFRVWNNYDDVTVGIQEAEITAVRFRSYTVRRTQYSRLCSQQLGFLTEISAQNLTFAKFLGQP